MVFNWYLFTIGINWYLNLYLFYIPHCVLSIMYFQLVYLIDIMMHSIDIFFFFQLVSRKFCFDFTLHCIFCLRQNGENIVFFDPFVDDWQKGGERFWVLYAYLCFCIYWVLCMWEKWFDLRILNKKREGFWNICLIHAWWCIFMFSIHCIYLLFIAMHELRGSFLEA